MATNAEMLAKVMAAKAAKAAMTSGVSGAVTDFVARSRAEKGRGSVSTVFG